MFSSDDVAVWTCSQVTECVECKEAESDSCSCFHVNAQCISADASHEHELGRNMDRRSHSSSIIIPDAMYIVVEYHSGWIVVTCGMS